MVDGDRRLPVGQRKLRGDEVKIEVEFGEKSVYNLDRQLETIITSARHRVQRIRVTLVKYHISLAKSDRSFDQIVYRS